jgi:hypothetical protein
VTPEHVDRLKKIADQLAELHSELMWNGQETTQCEVTFAYVDLAGVAVTKALAVNGVKVNW